MARFLIAWELGDGYGHIQSLLPLAQALRQRGHTATFALANQVKALAGLGAEWTVHTLATQATPDKALAQPASAPECWLGYGFGDAKVLSGNVTLWINLIRQLQPDVLIADYAPCAKLAALTQGLPQVNLGFAFWNPPLTQPLRSFREWEAVDENRILANELRVQAAINQVLQGLNVAGLPSLAHLWLNALTLITTPVEFDPHHALRSREIMLGPLVLPAPVDASAAQPIWPDADGIKVLGYLRAEHGPSMQHGIAALTALPVRALVHVAGLNEEQAHALSTPRVRITSAFLDFGAALPRADLMVSQGGANTTFRALLSGVPVFALPTHAEQYITAVRAHQQGLGGYALPDCTAEQVLHYLASCAQHQASLKAQAQQFAARYGGLAGSQQRLEIAVTKIEALLTDK